MFCFNEFAFTVQVKHKINSTQILGLILIFLYFPTGHFHTCVLCKECSRYLPFLILGSVFSDCVVFYGDTNKSVCLSIYLIHGSVLGTRERRVSCQWHFDRSVRFCKAHGRITNAHDTQTTLLRQSICSGGE